MIERVGKTFSSRLETAAYSVSTRVASGVIKTSLFAATDAAGISDAVAVQIAEVFSTDIDFHRDLRKGDRFAAVYEIQYHQGEPVKTGRLLSAEFVNNGKTFQAVWFQNPDGEGGYYTPDGKNFRKAFLRSPLEFSRVSSGFTMARFHPVLQTWRAHKGVDYAAPTGTRVKATADGVIEFVGKQGGYGNLVVLRHQSKFTTWYGHLSGFAQGMQKGKRVAQGDVIGFVGSTGVARGLGHRAGGRGQVINVAALCGLAVVGVGASASPDAAMLHGQGHEVMQCGVFVPIDAGAVGEAAKNLVFPRQGVPGLGGGISKFFELPTDHTHVGGRAKNNGIGGGQRLPSGVGQVAIGVNGEQLGPGALRH